MKISELEFLNSWNGAVEIDSTNFNSVSEISSDLVLNENTIIILKSKENASAGQRAKASDDYIVEVRPYMTTQATPSFDFMEKWNNDNPMPLKIMVGTIEKETRGMYYMKLHAEILEDKMCVCMKCGKPITNPVSQYFGMGPECGNHNYTNPFNSEDELHEAVSNYKKELSKITWEGWVIKSAITRLEKVGSV